MNDSRQFKKYSTTRELTNFFNLNNAKKCAFLIMIFFLIYHGYLMIKLGNNSCKFLLQDGHFQNNYNWQPHGCMVHNYSRQDAKTCFKYAAYWDDENRFIFVGDDRLVPFYESFLMNFYQQNQRQHQRRQKQHQNQNNHHRDGSNVSSFKSSAPLKHAHQVGRSTAAPPPPALPRGAGNNNNKQRLLQSRQRRNIKSEAAADSSSLRNSSRIAAASQSQGGRSHHAEPVKHAVSYFENHFRQKKLNLKAHFFNMKNPGFSLIKSIGKLNLPKIKKTLPILVIALGPNFINGSANASIALSIYKEALENLAVELKSLKSMKIFWMLQEHVDEALIESSSAASASMSSSSTSASSSSAPFDFAATAARSFQFLRSAPSLSSWTTRPPNSASSPSSSSYKSPSSASSNSEPFVNIINNDLVNEMNSIALDIFKPLKNVEIWNSNRPITKHCGFSQSYSTSESIHFQNGFYVSQISLYWYVQILLNMYCNDPMKFYDGTCCSIPEPVTNLQLSTFIVFLICIIISTVCSFYNHFFLVPALKQSSSDSKARISGKTASTLISTHHRVGSDLPPIDASFFHSIYELSTALSKLGVILGYFFVCDRTIFFMKENKAFTSTNFILTTIYVFVLGFFFTDHSQKTGILHRDITEEWKGWLQLFILIYHITGASKVLPIYMMARLAVSSYLFMTGYGHFCWFWTKPALKSDSKLPPLNASRLGQIMFFVQKCWNSCLVSRRKHTAKRFLEIMFRLNLLTFLLCLTMNRAYQVYYFIPLVSFNFLIVFVTMNAWPFINAETVEGKKSQSILMLLKLLAAFAFISLLFSFRKFFNRIFLSYPLRFLFLASDDYPNQWFFRWSVDRYTCLAGMAYGFVYQTLKQNRLIVDNHAQDIFKRFSIHFSLFGLIAIASYLIFASFCPDKHACNSVHPYICFIPILGYVAVRNLIGSHRQRFSSIFRWFGRISLELYVAQYHIWLAADAHGVLVLIPSNHVVNLLLTSFIFVCVCHELHQLTATLAQYLVPSSCKGLLCTAVVMLVLLGPLAISSAILD